MCFGHFYSCVMKRCCRAIPTPDMPTCTHTIASHTLTYALFTDITVSDSLQIAKREANHQLVPQGAGAQRIHPQQEGRAAEPEAADRLPWQLSRRSTHHQGDRSQVSDTSQQPVAHAMSKPTRKLRLPLHISLQHIIMIEDGLISHDAASFINML